MTEFGYGNPQAKTYVHFKATAVIYHKNISAQIFQKIS